jgi:hypothetical protein
MLSVVATALIALCLVAVSGGPASAQAEGGEFCDVFGALLGEAGQTECENQGGNQVPVSGVTDATCSAADMLLTQVEDGGGEALAGPIRQLFTDTGLCVFGAAQQDPTTTAPSTTSTHGAVATGPTLAITGGPLALGAGAGAVLSGLVGLALALITLGLRRSAHHR